MTMWKDATSYQQGDRAKGVGPSAWSIKCGDVTVWVGHGHINNPGYWTMHCAELRMDTVDTMLPDTVDASVAQSAAIALASHKAKSIAKDLAKLSIAMEEDK